MLILSLVRENAGRDSGRLFLYLLQFRFPDFSGLEVLVLLRKT